MRKVSNESFIQLLKGQEAVDSNGRKLTALRKDSYGQDEIFIDNINVTHIEISEGDYTIPIRIKDLETSRFIIKGGCFSRITISQGFKAYLFSIDDGTFDHLEVFGGEIYSFNIEANIDKIEIHELKIVDNITLQGSIFETIDIFGIEANFFEIININIKEDLTFLQEARIKNLIVDTLTDCENVSIGGQLENISFQDCVVNSIDFSLFESKSIEVERCNIKWIQLYEGFADKFLLDANTYVNGFLIYSKINFSLTIEGSKINMLRIKGEIERDGRLVLKYLSINQFLIKDLFNEGKISIIELKSSGRYINQVKHEDDLQEIDANPSKIAFENSALGSISFFNCSFNSFDEVIVKDSRIDEIITSNQHVPVSDEKEIFTNENHEKDPQYLEELYNQLYLAMQKQGNRTQEIKYYTEYLEWHRLNKVNTLKARPFLNLLLKQDWYTPTALWFHKKTSSYGTNWIRSFLILLLIGLLLYFAYSISLPEIEFRIELLTLESVLFHFKFYTRFLLPTHDFILIKNTSPTGWSALWDILGRIVIGFLIYQTIAAFRRFGRR